MTPARSLAASVVALGFASTLTAPTPALAAPAPCERAESYAAQSGAEVLRIQKLEVRTVGAERPTTQEEPESAAPALSDATGRVLGSDPSTSPSDSDTISEGVTRTGEAVLGVLGLKPSDTTPEEDPTNPRAADPKSADPKTAKPEAGSAPGGGGAVTRRADDRQAISNLAVGEARTALIGDARTKSAAVARVVNSKGDLGRPLFQQAPPSHDRPATRSSPAGKVGPLEAGSGQLGAHARWADGMACGQTAGEASRSEAAVGSVNLLGGSLVRMTERATSSSRTGIDREAGDARTVASATVGTGRIDLLGGKVQIRVLRAPKLAADMSASGQGAVRYQPAAIEVSGGDVQRKRLDAAGEHVDITLRSDRRAMESLPLSRLTGVGKAARLPLPTVPGLPSVSEQDVETTPAGGPGTRVRISLGEVRQATKGHAIAALATAIKVGVSHSEATGGRGKAGYGDQPRSTVSLALGVGLLEAAAVAPAKAPAGVSPAVAGVGGGLPITGPRTALLAYGGVGLLVAGVIAVLAGMKRRRPRS